MADTPTEVPQESNIKYPKVVNPGSFEAEHHFYTKVINAQIHPLVSYFLSLDTQRLISRYCHLNPKVDKEGLTSVLSYSPSNFRWAGADLFYVTEAHGGRRMVIIETNSCPSGQKSMPFSSDHDESSGYRVLLEKTFKPLMDEQAKLGVLPEGGLAVVYDKNYMEASGYASVMADLFQEKVYLVEFYESDKDPSVRWTEDRVLQVRTPDGVWHPLRAAFRYVTQKPWKRFPVQSSKTLILNPVVACLAGGRNKLIASKAYDFFNAKYASKGLSIKTPETKRDVSKNEIPLWVNTFGGHAVIKVPYSNAGQGVYTITSKEELDRFMKEEESDYDEYIVQSLIGNYSWSSTTRHGQYFHVGTIPDRNLNIYCADIRMMIYYDLTIKSWRPLIIYSRRAANPLAAELENCGDSWQMLGTNLSYKTEHGTWATDTNRLLIMDRRDFNRLGIGADDLIDAFIQTVMATVAIDQMGKNLRKENGEFDIALFESLNKDKALISEIMI